MKITEVSYRALRTGHGYNNTAVEAKAEVGDGQDADAVLAELKHWVDGQVDEQLKRHDAYETLSSLGQQIVYAKSERDRLEKRVEAMREIVREHQKLADLARNHGLGGCALLLDQANGRHHANR